MAGLSSSNLLFFLLWQLWNESTLLTELVATLKVKLLIIYIADIFYIQVIKTKTYLDSKIDFNRQNESCRQFQRFETR